MIGEIGSSFATASASSASEKSRALFDDSSETYLQLFLTQLKNQDPSEPFKVADMTRELSQLNNSQQLIGINSNLETLIASNNTSQAASVTNFINKDVTYTSDKIYADGQNPNYVSFDIDEVFSNVRIDVINSSGKTVHSNQSELSLGRHDYSWDGIDENGNPVNPGKYSVVVSGIEEGKTPTPIRTFVTGKVNGVDFTSGGEPVITVGFGEGRFDISLKDVAALNDYSSFIAAAEGNS